MGHDQCTDQSSRYAPRRCPGKRFVAFFVLEFNFLGFGKVLPKKVRRSRLQCFAVLHHGFDRIRRLRAGESFADRFFAFDHGHGHVVFGEVRVHVQHQSCFFQSLFFGRVSGMAFLP